MSGVAIQEPADSAGAGELVRIPLTEIHESKHNPRQHYEPEALGQLKDSLLASGQLEPILVRPRKAGGYELAAGHRRFRAAKLACEQYPDGARFRGLGELLAIVRELDDRAYIETLQISNLQRDDLHSLEEAQGFSDLMTSCGYDIKKIAARIGKSERYVYDSLTLLKLIPEAKKLFLEGRFERGHAIELARLTPQWQQEALDPEGASDYGPRAGLWQPEHADADPNPADQERLDLDEEDAVKPVSVRELKTWINDHVRATPDAVDPMLFPTAAEVLAKAQAAKGRAAKIVHITYDYQVPGAARDPKIKTYGENGWKRADGQFTSKICDRAVVGFVVAGPGRGEAFLVCVDKEKCAVHWRDWQQERERRRKALAKGTRTSGKTARDRYAEREARRQLKLEAERERWGKAQPAILSAMAEKLKAAPAGANSALADAVLQFCMDGRKAYTQVPRGRTAEDLLRHAAFQLYARDVRDLAPGYYHHEQALKNIKSVGLDPQKIVDQVAPEEKPAKASAKPAKKAKSKKGKKR
jgi:ParB/RepB/Spo0J family partition protein